MQYLKEISFILAGEKFKLPIILFFIIFGSLLDLLGLSIIGPFVMFLTNPEVLINKYETNFLLMYIEKYIEQPNFIEIVGFIFVIIFILRTLITILIKYLILRFTLNLRVKIQNNLLQSFLDLPYASYTNKNSSYYIETITNLVARFTTTVSSILSILSELAIISFIWFFLLIQNFKATLIITLTLIFLVLIYDFLFKKKLINYGQSTSEGSKTLLQSLVETINGFKEIKILGVENFFKTKVRFGAEQIAKNLIKSGVISSSPRYFYELILIIFFVGYSLVFLQSNLPVLNLLPQLSVFGLAAIRVLPAANQFTNSFLTIRFGRYASSQLYESMKTENKQLNKYGKLDPKLNNKISNFDHLKMLDVSFKYPSRDKIIIKKFNLTINRGEFIGIRGTTGSGKTTLIDLITGLLDPKEGKILINDQPINLHLDTWRNQLAYIPQQIVMTDDTIKSNIALGEELDQINNTKLLEVIDKAKLNKFIKELPNGLNTIIGDRGLQISGGQRQRIALARAFYYNRNILILDESTNSLDKKTEIEILEQIKLLKGDKTIIIISHDDNCFKYCDKIFHISGN